MKDLNVITVSGRATRDMELKGSEEKPVGVFSIAVTTDVFKKEGESEYTEVVDFHEVVCYGSRAKALAALVKKGVPLEVIGRMRADKWEDGDKKGTNFFVEVTNKGDINVKSPKKASEGSKAEAAATEAPAEEDEEDDGSTPF